MNQQEIIKKIEDKYPDIDWSDPNAFNELGEEEAQSVLQELVSMMPTPNRTPYVREERKIGRNELCSCGSGKKYKKCCL